MPAEYQQNVFINCPFDNDYTPLFEAIVFAVQDSGFRPRSARERLDSGEMRLAKLRELIHASRYSIHDLSRTQLDVDTALPRFNMPFELGLDLGCRWFAPKRQDKALLIFDSEHYRYQKFLSDIAGHDIDQHRDDPFVAVLRIRHWLRASSGKTLRAGSVIHNRYLHFRLELPKVCTELSLDIGDLSFPDFSYAVAVWIREHPHDDPAKTSA
jgi:hypothetical protein